MSLLFKSTYVFEKINFYKYETSFLAYYTPENEGKLIILVKTKNFVTLSIFLIYDI